VGQPLTVQPTGPPEGAPWEYSPAAEYQLSVLVLLSRADRSGVAFATHAAITALGHRRGGTVTTDAQFAGLFGVSAQTMRRQRHVLIDCDVLTETARGKQVLRRTKRPDEFVTVPRVAVAMLLRGQITARAFRLKAYLIHRRAERGLAAGCALTRAEIAEALGIRPDAVSADVAALESVGLLHIQTRPGVGWVLTPKWCGPNNRRISIAARYQMRERRRRWGLPRYGTQSTGPSPAPDRASVTPLPFGGQPARPFGGQPRPTDPASAQVSQHSPATATRTMGFQRPIGPSEGLPGPLFAAEPAEAARNRAAIAARLDQPWARRLLPLLGDAMAALEAFDAEPVPPDIGAAGGVA
jgi:hypothetical protein